MKIIDENQEIARQKPINSILTLVNVKKAEITPVLINKIVKTMRKNNPHVLATAVIGLSAFQRVILDTVVSLTGRNVAVLDNFIEAQLWLYDQYKRKAAIEI
ncbi:MAG: hypothetical protein R3345_08385 [Fulvivirga sp.]|nr:hypothetical protein [Fulvivirga sp.]